MSLATRLSIFFLATLAVVLICFSLALWFFQRWMMLHHSDEVLMGTIDTLVASIEIEPDGVEWNPLEHRFDNLNGEHAGTEWSVTSGSGMRVDQSSHFDQISNTGTDAFVERRIIGIESRDGRPWRIVIDRVGIPPELAEQEEPSSVLPGPDDVPEYPELVITCAIPISDVHATLNQLAMVLVALCAGVWILAAVFGRRLAHRALRPLTAMAVAATRMDGTNGGRLPVATTNDEVEELGRSFNALLARLQQAFDRERRFTAEASHQLRTPITILLGQVDVALRRDRSESEYRETLITVRSQADRLRTIVESLLSLARSESQHLKLERVALANWLPEYLSEFSGHPRAGDLRFDRDDQGSADVDTAVELLAQLLEILVENAMKHTAPATPIVVRLGRAGTTIVIDVIDSGPGIPDAEAADIFRPFHRGHAAIHAGVPGLGLGLALARRIAERLGVGLEYERMTRGGSRFRVVFDEAARETLIPSTL